MLPAYGEKDDEVIVGCLGIICTTPKNDTTKVVFPTCFMANVNTFQNELVSLNTSKHYKSSYWGS